MLPNELPEAGCPAPGRAYSFADAEKTIERGTIHTIGTMTPYMFANAYFKVVGNAIKFGLP
jgi:hypothetical protein